MIYHLCCTNNICFYWVVCFVFFSRIDSIWKYFWIEKKYILEHNSKYAIWKHNIAHKLFKINLALFTISWTCRGHLKKHEWLYCSIKNCIVIICIIIVFFMLHLIYLILNIFFWLSDSEYIFLWKKYLFCTKKWLWFIFKHLFYWFVCLLLAYFCIWISLMWIL